MIGRDCRCPGCGTCDAASEVERLRERLAVERTPNGAGKWNAERVLREKAERERDEARHTLGRIAAVLFSSRAPLDDEELVEAMLMVIRERDELRAQLAFMRDEYGINADNGTLTRDALEKKP